MLASPCSGSWLFIDDLLLVSFGGDLRVMVRRTCCFMFWGGFGFWWCSGGEEVTGCDGLVVVRRLFS